MTAHEDAEKAVAEALQANWNLWPADALRMAQDAVAAAAPILLADAQLVFETLTVTSKMRDEQVERLIAEVARWKALVDAKQSWIDGAKVDLDGYADDQAEYEVAVRSLTAERDEARAEVERLQADLRESVCAIDHYAGALRITPEIVAAERARIERLFEQRHYPGRVWTLMDLRAVVHHPAPAETAPETTTTTED